MEMLPQKKAESVEELLPNNYYWRIAFHASLENST
jgi:hypothetical protein